MRIKRGTTKNARHKKVLSMAKGYRMSYSKLYRKAKEAVRHAGSYSFIHRKHRKSQKREEWIQAIAARLSTHGLSYSVLVAKLKEKGVIINRKVLGAMAMDHASHFDKIVSEVK